MHIFIYFFLFFLFLKKGLEGKMKVNGIQVKLFYINDVNTILIKKKDMIFIIGKG